ncbi:MAG: pyridoxal-phosphate dependent enzyme [Zestosphaera sp.]
MKALRVVEESRGSLIFVSNEEILRSMKMLVRVEGVGVEPAGAASLAGYLKAVEDGIVEEGDDVVLVRRGYVLKDSDTIHGPAVD